MLDRDDMSGVGDSKDKGRSPEYNLRLPVLREAFNQTYDVIDVTLGGEPTKQPRKFVNYFLGWPDTLPPNATGSNKAKRFFAAVFAIIGMPLNVLLVKPIKLLELLFKAAELKIEREYFYSNNPVANFFGHAFGIMSSFIRYTVSLNPYQAVVECSNPFARPSQLFGRKVGKWIGGFIGGVLSLAGIVGFAFLIPTAIINIAGAIAGTAVATTVSEGFAAVDAALKLANAGAATVGAVGGVVSSSLAASGVGLAAVATGVGVVNSTAGMMRELNKDDDDAPPSPVYKEPENDEMGDSRSSSPVLSFGDEDENLSPKDLNGAIQRVRSFSFTENVDYNNTKKFNRGRSNSTS